MNRLAEFKKLLSEKKLFKVIAGMENFNQENVKMVVNAATLGRANAVDISADSEVIEWVKENHPSLILFVSSLSPKMLVKAGEWGADVLELGNFDALYTQGKSISKEELIQLTRELRQLAGENKMICITVPGNLKIEEQVSLAVQLQAAGADLLQVENLKAESNYKNAQEIAAAVQIPVLLSGKINSENIEKARKTGVNAIGVGNAINSKNSLPEMVEEVSASMKKINSVKVGV